jgi:hypothetical protein
VRGKEGVEEEADHVDCSHPFVCCEVDFSCEVVEVAKEGGHDLCETGVGGWAGGGDDFGGEVEVVEGRRCLAARLRAVGMII